MYVCNKRTKIIHTKACGYTKIMKNGKTDIDFQDAIDSGYHFCPHCSTVMKALKKEQAQLDAFCKNKKMRYWAEDGMLIVSTPSSFYRIVPGFNGEGMYLWHQNGISCHKFEKFKNYHNQNKRLFTLEGMFKYIYKHDCYREERPVGIKPPKIKEGLGKGGKKYRAQQRRIEKYEKRRDKINAVNNVFFLFSQLEAQKRA